MREFDIAAIYLYERDGGVCEVHRRRQRLNAIMSFLGQNPGDEHNGFALRIQNEVAEDADNGLEHLTGSNFADLNDKAAILDYELTTSFCPGYASPLSSTFSFYD